MIADRLVIPPGGRAVLRRERRPAARLLPGQRPTGARDRRGDADARGGGPARDRVRVLLLQQQLQDHAGRCSTSGCGCWPASTGSVLWLLADNAAAGAQPAPRGRGARRRAGAAGLRAAACALDEHLARHRLADLFLDTLPYNAHTTASDALWAGLPVLTCLGSAFAGPRRRQPAARRRPAGAGDRRPRRLRSAGAAAGERRRRCWRLRARLARAARELPAVRHRPLPPPPRGRVRDMWERQQRGEPPAASRSRHSASPSALWSAVAAPAATLPGRPRHRQVLQRRCAARARSA